MTLNLQKKTALQRKDDRIIIHFDYDCFYASVVEHEQPALKNVPLAIQQKQIVVTCNYEARRRGLHKLQLITDAKRTCPEVVIVLGEDLTRFRDASRELYDFLRQFSWNDRVERLGFDEVWMDVTDLIEHNMSLLRPRRNSEQSFFQISLADPSAGFHFDAKSIAGHAHPMSPTIDMDLNDPLTGRLMLGSHLALYLRHQIEEAKGYTCTVGISTSRLLSKLVGNLHKPKGQTTLLPPYDVETNLRSNVMEFMDQLDIGAVPWIGFKLAQKLREYVLGREADYDAGLVYGPTKEAVSVGSLRQMPGLTPIVLQRILGGPGASHDIGLKVFALIHGVDDTEVANARSVPRQISIEDSYTRLDTFSQVQSQLQTLSERLIQRMRIDLIEPRQELSTALQNGPAAAKSLSQKWIGHPTTIRLSTRPRPPLSSDGTRTRTFKRLSRSGTLPGFVFNINDSVPVVAKRLVSETVIPLFKRLHPERSGWNLSLVNIAVTDIRDMAKGGRDITSMLQFERPTQYQPNTSKQPEARSTPVCSIVAPGDADDFEDSSVLDEEEQSASGLTHFVCGICGTTMPHFAKAAHERFHRDSASGL